MVEDGRHGPYNLMDWGNLGCPPHVSVIVPFSSEVSSGFSCHSCPVPRFLVIEWRVKSFKVHPYRYWWGQFLFLYFLGD